MPLPRFLLVFGLGRLPAALSLARHPWPPAPPPSAPAGASLVLGCRRRAYALCLNEAGRAKGRSESAPLFPGSLYASIQRAAGSLAGCAAHKNLILRFCRSAGSSTVCGEACRSAGWKWARPGQGSHYVAILTKCVPISPEPISAGSL